MKKKIVSIFLAVLMLVGIIPAQCFAAASAPTEAEALGEINIYSDGKKLNYLVAGGSVREQYYTYYNYVSSSGSTKQIPAYCVNPNLYGVPQKAPIGTGVEYLANEKSSDPKVIGIVANGYPNKSLSELGLKDKYEAYYATKIAVWCHIISGWSISGLKVNPALSGADREAAERVLAAAKKTYEVGMTWTETIEPSVTCTPDKDAAYPVTVDGESYKQQIFTFWSKTWVTNYDVKVAFADPDSVPAGTRIVDMDNNDITNLVTERNGNGFGAQFKILYPADSVEGKEGSVQLSFTTNVYQYAIFYAECQETDKYGNLQNYIVDTDPTITMRLSSLSKYTKDNTPAAPDEPVTETDTGLVIRKLEDGTNKPLEGALFEVIDPEGRTVGVFSTDSSGMIALPLEICGNYTVIETKSPGYHLLPERTAQNVNVKYGETAELTFYNAPYGNLTVEKYSSSGEKLSGATIQIRHIESGATYSKQTGFNGAAEFTQLKPGAYEIKEVTAPAGYIKDAQTHTTTVVSGETGYFTLVNEELPGLLITKYDRKTSSVMPEVTFEVFKDTVSIGTFKTDQLGQIKLTNLAPGTYTVKEVNVDGTHILDTTPQSIELKGNDGIRELTFFNDVKPGLHLVKIDSQDPSKTIAGAVFEVKSVDGSYGPKEFTTDANGEIDLSALNKGAYVVTEKSVNGYVIDEASRTIQLDPNEDAEFVFTNTIKPSIEIVKVSSDGTPLPGVSFRIAKSEDGSHYLDRVTNQSGKILISDLQPGVYSVVETATVSDHIINTREYHVQLFPGKVSTLVVENAKRPNLTVYKNDADTGEPVPGTVFQVRTADGHSVDEIKTDADGKVSLVNLLPGVYEVSEKSVPSAYLLDAPSQLITLYPNRDGSIYFTNHKKPALTIEKLDSITKNPVQGAKFSVVWASNNTKTGDINDLGTFFTDENGQIVIDGLSDGWLKITELEPAKGYQIKAPAVQETFIKGGESKTVIFENTPLSALAVFKYDSKTGEAVNGAVFQLKLLAGTSGTGGTVIGTYKTSNNGAFTVTGLKAGTYIVEEIASDDDHIIDSAPQTVYISGKDQDVVSVFFGNSPKGSLLVKKIDAVTKEPLSDVEFFAAKADGTLLGNANGKFKTDSKGTFLIEGLDPGTSVIVKETKARDGYILDDAAQTAEIKAGETVSLEFRNQPVGSLLVKKVDAATGEPLSDVEFFVTDGKGTPIGNAKGKFYTDKIGSFLVTGLDPETTVVVKEVKAKDGYILDDTPQTVTIKSGKAAVLEFRNQPVGSLLVKKVDAATGAPLSDVEFFVTDGKGTPIGNAKGKFITDESGSFVVTDLDPETTVVVKETRAKDGYILDDIPQTVIIKSGKAAVLEFRNQPKGNLIINKLDASDKKTPLKGVTFKITYADGRYVDAADGKISTKGLYYTDKNGQIILADVVGTVVVTEVETIRGYRIDEAERSQTVQVNPDDTQILTFYNQPLSGILIHKIDSETRKGIYGVRFLVYDSGKNPVGEYTSDQNGYVYVNDLPGGGKYYVRELEAAEGYLSDDQLKTIYVKDGETAEITWKNTPVKGQIQIMKYAAEDNNVTGQKAGTPLKGAVYEVTRERSGKVVDYITTDAHGIAATSGLPLGRYIIKEVQAPAYWQISGKTYDVTLEYEGQIIKLSDYDKPAELAVSITKSANAQILAGSKLTYTLTVANKSNVELSDFYMQDKLPYDNAAASVITTGTYNQRLTYRILYRTNMNDYRVLASNLLSTNNYALTLGNLKLQQGEVVTDIYFDFGTVPSGFSSQVKPTVTVSVNPNAVNGYNLVNRAYAGGKYMGTWETANASWTTIVRNLTKRIIILPKTGY